MDRFVDLTINIMISLDQANIFTLVPTLTTKELPFTLRSLITVILSPSAKIFPLASLTINTSSVLASVVEEASTHAHIQGKYTIHHQHN